MIVSSRFKKEASVMKSQQCVCLNKACRVTSSSPVVVKFRKAPPLDGDLQQINGCQKKDTQSSQGTSSGSLANSRWSALRTYLQKQYFVNTKHDQRLLGRTTHGQPYKHVMGGQIFRNSSISCIFFCSVVLENVSKNLKLTL